jgi:ABC-type antimicrobial peptide transport system permease subunit
MGILTRAIRNISRRKTRALIVIIALSLALTLLIVLPPNINVSTKNVKGVINALTANANYVNSTVTLAATEIDGNLGTNFSLGSFLNGAYGNVNTTKVFTQYNTVSITDYSGLNKIPDVSTVIPVLEQNVPQLTYGEVDGVPLDNASLLKDYPSILPANIIEGRNLQADDSGVVILQQNLANIYNVTVGSTFNISGTNFKVVGIEGPEAVNTTYVTMSLADAQALTNTTGQASDFKIYVDNVDNVNSVATRITSEYPKLQVSEGLSQVNSVQQVLTLVNQQVQTAQNVMNQIQNNGLIEISIAVIADIAIILFMMLYSVRERTREIGTLKAMGASNTTILGQFIFEGVLLSVMAAVVALVIGGFGATTLAKLLLPHPTIIFPSAPGSNSGMMLWFTNYATVTPELILEGLGVAVLLGALGSLYPALKAARTRPAEAMRYE